MKREEKASLSIMKIMCVTIILILISGIAVMAVNTNLKDTKIVLKNGYELSVLTSKTTVSEVLKENNIILDEDEKMVEEANHPQMIVKIRVPFELKKYDMMRLKVFDF